MDWGDYLLRVTLVKDYIRKGEIHKLKELMKNSREQAMQTFDQALFDLYRADIISYDDALDSADSRNEVRLMIKLNAGNTDTFEKNDMLLTETDDGKNFFRESD